MAERPDIPGMKGKSKAGSKKKEPQQPMGLPDEAQDEVFEEDFSDVEVGGFALASEGKHHAKLIDFEKTESSKGNPQFVWQFRILAGDSEGIEVRFWTSLLPQARWKVVETLEALGIEAEGTISRFKRSDLIGSPCIIEVFHDEYDGRTNAKVDRVYPPTEETIKISKSDTPV